VQGIVATSLIGISLGAQYALLALGFTLIFGILGVVNFAHGGFYVLGGHIAYSAISFLGMPYALAVITAALGTAALGYLFERFLLDRPGGHSASGAASLARKNAPRFAAQVPTRNLTPTSGFFVNYALNKRS
jgi:branched-subunit amino acid ABC-type transport system permease component